MPKLLHVADLHLTHTGPDRDYSLAVLRDIVRMAEQQEVDAVILAGDIFDSVQACMQLRQEFLGCWDHFDKPIFYIPGNHEDSGVNYENLSCYDWRNITFLAKRPYQFLTAAETGLPLEILALPHQQDCGDYFSWDIPTKAHPRMIIAHGLVPGMSYQGQEVEAGGQVLDPQMFAHFAVDYVALGHIHGQRQQLFGSTLCAYPGSARVWRHGESGPRTVNLVTTGDNLVVTPTIISAAGEYRTLDLTLDLEGDLPPAECDAGSDDWVHVLIGGLASDEMALQRREKVWEEKWIKGLPKKPRRITFDHAEVLFSNKLRQHPLAKEFLKVWESLKPIDDTPDFAWNQQVWLKAREQGLTLIRDRLESGF